MVLGVMLGWYWGCARGSTRGGARDSTRGGAGMVLRWYWWWCWGSSEVVLGVVLGLC